MKSFLVALLLAAFYLILLREPKCTPKRVVVNNRQIKPTKLMIVAHPDDELLWGHRYLLDDPKSWKVICVCCASDPVRVQEFQSVMAAIGVDNYEMWDNENTIIAWRLHPLIINRIKSEVTRVQGYDSVVTHNWYGEYGNLQHMAVHRAVTAANPNVLVFSPLPRTEMSSKNKLVSISYPSQRWIVKALTPFHSKY